MAAVPTVKVQHPDDPKKFMLVNEADAKSYKPFGKKTADEDEKPAETKKAAATEPKVEEPAPKTKKAK